MVFVVNPTTRSEGRNKSEPGIDGGQQYHREVILEYRVLTNLTSGAATGRFRQLWGVLGFSPVQPTCSAMVPRDWSSRYPHVLIQEVARQADHNKRPDVLTLEG